MPLVSIRTATPGDADAGTDMPGRGREWVKRASAVLLPMDNTGTR